ncbi:MAG: DUF1236 domain-containing protein [Afipia sp.]|nr:DUF1236 domain-containing protein [Afipia sp.]OJW66269.1 MAG: hypothetical protein BGO65_04325 [Afipia sp. 64-13]
MNRTAWMISTTALTFAIATGVASAQSAAPGGMKGGEAPAATAPANPGGAAKGNMGAEHSAPAGARGERHGAGENGMTNAPKQAQENRSGSPSKSQAQSDTKGPNEMKGGAKSANESNMKGDKGSTASETRSNAGAGKTTGNAATSATAAPPAEKRSQISSAIRQEKVKEVTHVNFNISVGARVPTSVHYYPLPARIVEIYPEWRGYDFILVNGRYIILRPDTHEIVYIIES